MLWCYDTNKDGYDMYCCDFVIQSGLLMTYTVRTC